MSAVSDYEALVVTPEQAFSIFALMPVLERTLTALVAITATRISEALALTWDDIDWERSLIYVRRAWVRGRMQKPKSKASKAPVPMHEALAMIFREWRAQSPYARDSDLIFASAAKKGTKPRTATMLVQDYVRPCAVKAGVLTINDGETFDYNGHRIGRFGFHNFRHSLASFLSSRVMILSSFNECSVTAMSDKQWITPTLIGREGKRRKNSCNTFFRLTRRVQHGYSDTY